MGRHRARTLLGCGVLRFTNHRGVSIRLPLKPELLAMIATLHPEPAPKGVRPRNVIVLGR